jgi:hypothetical protein
MHGKKIILPQRETDWPDQDRLSMRFNQYKNSTG